MGYKGSRIINGNLELLLYRDDSFYEITAYDSPITADATGCGDTYMCGYL